MDMLLDIASDVYKLLVTTDRKGTKQLIVQCQNAIYGTMVASILYYHKFCKSLTSIGVKVNPYDFCVANKMIGGKHMTITFHVDDCKLSHKDSKEMDKMIPWLRKEYKSIFEDGSGRMIVEPRKDSHLLRYDPGLYYAWPSEDHDDRLRERYPRRL